MILQTALLALAMYETAAPQSATSTPPKAERKICRVEGGTTGTRMSQGKRICRTAAEWETERNRVQADVDQVKRGAER